MYKRIHLTGAGGIGMSALAQCYSTMGSIVSGSDRQESPTTLLLKEKGITIHLGHDAEYVSDDVELLVYSDAVPADNPERVRASELGIPERSYFEALGDIAATKRTIAIAGTHGKTTTTAMLGSMLVAAGLDPTIIVGSIVSEWGSNYREGKSDILVVEACEYRNHLLHFSPDILVITNIELDHTDFFPSLEALHATFEDARQKAHLVIEADTYMNEVVPPLLVPGEFNKENARAAKAAAKAIAPEVDEVLWDSALSQYRGTWRRFEYKGLLPEGALLYDDYAHHPTAVGKTIAAAREQFPDKKIVVFFHPHLYSRTRDFFDAFAAALATADEAYILPIYAAREIPDEKVSHTALAEAVVAHGGKAEALSDLVEAAARIRTFGVEYMVLTMGAGDVYTAGERALEA